MWWVCVHRTRVRVFLHFCQGNRILQYPLGLINLPVEYVRKKTETTTRPWKLGPPIAPLLLSPGG